MTLISWAAVLLGFAGAWIAGKHRTGWLIANLCCALWLIYDIDRAIWAGALGVTVSLVINTRNWAIQTKPPTQTHQTR